MRIFFTLSAILLLSFIIPLQTNAGWTTYPNGTSVWYPDNEETGDQEFEDWSDYKGSGSYETVEYNDYFESSPTVEYNDYFESSPQYFDYTPTYNTGCSNCGSYQVDSYNFEASYGSGYQYQESSYVSCFPNKYRAEKGENITWSVFVNSSSAVSYEWEGDEIGGQNSSKVIVDYSSIGEKTAHVNVTSGDNTTRYSCGSIFIEEPPLYISCQPNSTYTEEGGEVTWTADISGGDGSYDLEWKGHRDIDGENDNRVTIEYDTPGSYSADLEVRSGSQTRTVYCGNVSVSGSYSSPLHASCNANKTYANPGDIVEWKVNAIGGKGSYDYEWRGSDPVDGKEGNSIKVEYTTLGDKYAEVEACSKDDCIDISCGTVSISDKPEFGTLTYSPAYSNLEGSCIADKTDIVVGEEIIWQATVNQPIQSSLITWNGTDGLNTLRGDRQVVRYDTPGIKEGSFSVRTDSGELFTFTCPNTVNVRPLEAGTGLLSLGEVPYTGPGDVLKVVGLILLLMIWSAVTVVIIRRRIGKRKVTNIIENFKQENLNS